MERYSENAMSILDELHTERLDYDSEYVPLAYAIQALAAYEDAEEQGLLVRLPCKRRDNVYFILPDANEYLGYFVSEGCRITEVGTSGFWTSDLPDEEPDAMHDFTSWSEFGKTVFLTREEAEAALKEANRNG